MGYNPIAARFDFEQAVEIFYKAFVKNPKFTREDLIDQFRLTQADLRLEQPMVANTNNYLFPVLNNINNQNTQFNTEIRLPMNDSFVPTRVGIFLAFPSSTTDTTFRLVPYSSPFDSPNSVQLNAIYNGTLNILIQNDLLMKNWMINRHWKSNQTQQTAAPGAGSPLDQFDGDDDGFTPMQPFVLLLGSNDIQINIKLPIGPSAVDANSRLVVVFRGLQAQNSTVIN